MVSGRVRLTTNRGGKDMAVKSTRKQRDDELVLPFPKLMISTHNGAIILATSKGLTSITGTIVDPGESDTYPTGYVSRDWAAKIFIDYYGSVTLTNIGG
jgi:hypothetical protein